MERKGQSENPSIGERMASPYTGTLPTMKVGTIAGLSVCSIFPVLIILESMQIIWFGQWSSHFLNERLGRTLLFFQDVDILLTELGHLGGDHRPAVTLEGVLLEILLVVIFRQVEFIKSDQFSHDRVGP